MKEYLYLRNGELKMPVLKFYLFVCDTGTGP
jgi:hypothetical protein